MEEEIVENHDVLHPEETRHIKKNKHVRHLIIKAIKTKAKGN